MVFQVDHFMSLLHPLELRIMFIILIFLALPQVLELSVAARDLLHLLLELLLHLTELRLDLVRLEHLLVLLLQLGHLVAVPIAMAAIMVVLLAVVLVHRIQLALHGAVQLLQLDDLPLLIVYLILECLLLCSQCLKLLLLRLGIAMEHSPLLYRLVNL